jgi:hypothetical protein
MKYKTLEEMETAIKEVIDIGDRTPNTYKLLNRIKENFIQNKIDQYNIYNLKRHCFDGANRGENEPNLHDLSKGRTFNFSEVEKAIKDGFEGYSVAHKIEEVTPRLHAQKAFKLPKYCSWYGVTAEHLPMLDDIKRFPLHFCTDEYACRSADYLNNLVKFLELTCNIELKKYNQYEDGKTISLRDWEDSTNESNKGITIKIHKDWMYLTFSNKQHEEGFRDTMKKEVKDYINSR